MPPQLNGWEQYGLVGLMFAAGTTLLFIVIKWTLATTKEILQQAAKEREIFNNMQIEWINALNAHTEQAKAFHDEVKTAHDHQREEHERLMMKLDHVDERTRMCIERH